MKVHESNGQDASWSSLIDPSEWQVYLKVLEPALEQHIPFAIGGGFAFSHYARRWRNTKDIDLYVTPRDSRRMIDLLGQKGYVDLYDEKPYDRKWIYRGTQQGVIVDVIWSMANQRAQVDDSWLEQAPWLNIRGLALRMLPVEELIWSKLYVLQRDRCDWPDLLNILNEQGPTLQWDHLLARLDADVRLLGGVLSAFCWLCPSRAAELPAWIWERVGLAPPEGERNCDHDRKNVAYLDSRDWFGAKMPDAVEA